MTVKDNYRIFNKILQERGVEAVKIIIYAFRDVYLFNCVLLQQ